MTAKGIRILEVEAGSAADQIGLRSGDHILEINGHEVVDELAARFYLCEEYVDLYVKRPGGDTKHFEIHRSDTTELGIIVEEFRTRTCNNACLFCFVDQLPPGVRSSLRVKDDDYRLSFLYGNYVTLTNVTARDLDRIIEQRLSPLFVSIHATDPQIRKMLLGRKKADRLKTKLRKLVRGGIRIHAQIVLIPGLNDGKSLEKTLWDLYELYPGVQSVAVVPIGLSDHGAPKDRFTPVTAAYSRALIQTAEHWQKYFREKTGRAFAYLADEFYIQGGIEVPEASHYDDYSQIEDGVGMVRDFLDAFHHELDRRRKTHLQRTGTLVTGRLFSPILKRCMQKFNDRFGSIIEVLPVKSTFLGRNITVAGLLAGKDIVASLKGKKLGDFLIIPNDSLSRRDGILLDDMTIEDLSKNLGIPVYPSGRTLGDFFKLLFSIGK
jgi:putative radical SAM enzyme (TIGR03279 family)